MAEPSRRRILGLGLMAAAVTSCGPRRPEAAPAPHPSTGPGAGVPATGGPTTDGHTPDGHAAPKAERTLPGNPDWEITDPGPDGAIEGFADRVSVLPGESFGLHVSTPATAFTVSAYRMGWYDGARARLVWRREHVPGGRQAAPHVDQETRTVLTGWQRTLAVDTAGWPEGAYLLRLDAEDGSGRRYVPLTVRSASTAGRTVIMSAPATWQAYNEWGGYSLYNGPTGGLATRSLKVVFDRPYDYDHGAGLFLVYEAPLVALAERLGLPLAYTTGIDVAREPGLLAGASAVLSLGHDEYWSPEQRAHVAAARDAGTNLAVLGANCCFRRVRFEPTGLGPDRTVVCYKDAWAQDPGHRAGAPATTDFRAGPGADPESSLLGVIYDGYPVDAPYVVTSPGHWAFEGTGVAAGAAFPHLVGVEYDRVSTGFPTPRPIEVIAHSPVVCDGRRSHSDTAYYTVPSGAGVFATGTMRWVEALEARGPGGGRADHGIDAHAGDLVRRVTENVLRAFAAGPAGHTRPAQDNLAAVYGPA
ncbi:N,N-dimethylformamidase beta subunit family domain-containing protein [Streptomyces sp. CBMA156]|uniref:N,N-dimethylformamidase beta subunit family domain-containing protein n=1 Tax=Streptomyces sp. CBMA156 TaxID=1930280 RepID=UPI00294FEF73|nr:N,N-dimethylformamidase beta subunit family domain-containing protein [Streptomyces sp. CBMA156]